MPGEDGRIEGNIEGILPQFDQVRNGTIARKF